MSEILKELIENLEYQRILSQMSDEERKLAEKATKELLEQFEQNVLTPLKKSFEK